MTISFPRIDPLDDPLYIPKYNLDYSKKITSDMIDKSIIERKFAAYDYAVVNDLFKDASTRKDGENTLDFVKRVKQHKKALALLEDPTIYAYAFLKWDNKPLKLFYYQDVMINDKHKRINFESSNQIGKEQPYTAKVLTPSGFVTMGSLKVGDTVIAQDGKITQILQIFEQGIKPVYALEFDDESIAECGLDHLWLCQTPKERFRRKKNSKWDVLSLKDIMAIDGLDPKPINRIVIPVTKPVKFSEQKHIISPYLMGVLLGDGTLSSRAISISNHKDDDEIITKCESELPSGVTIRRAADGNNCIVGFGKKHKNPIKTEIERLKLQGTYSDTKFIPEEYLLDCPKNRIDLLRGLMDTDGCIYGKGSMEFTTISTQLKENFIWLVQSLGGKCTVREVINSYVHNGEKKRGALAYRISVKIQGINPFYLSRKANKFYDVRYRPERVLRHIKYQRTELSRCLLVDHPSHTYITDNFIVTHNSFTLCVKAAVRFLGDHGKNFIHGIVSQSMAKNSDNMRIIKLILSTANVNLGDIDKDNMSVTIRNISDEDNRLLYTNTLVCAVSGKGSLGFPFDELDLDEYEFWDNPEGLAYMYDQVFKPRTFETKGPIAIYSNPNGENFVSQDLQRRTLDNGSPEFHVYNFNYLDKPGNLREDWDREKRQTHPIIFASTMAAQRTEAKGTFLTQSEIRDSFSQTLHEKGTYAGKDKQCVFFLDVGVVHDQSVLTGIYAEKNEKGETVFCQFFEQFYPVTYPLWRVVGIDPSNAPQMAINTNDGWENRTVKSVREILEAYRYQGFLPSFGADVTGHAAIVPLCQVAGLSPRPITFSGPVKWTMYERLKTLLAQRRFKRGRVDNWMGGKNQDWAYQAAKLIIEKSPGMKYYKVHHETEDDLDDSTDSTCGALTLIDEAFAPSAGASFVGGESDKEFKDRISEQAQQLDPEFAEQITKDYFSTIQSFY